MERANAGTTKTRRAQMATLSTLVSFSGFDGEYPYAGLIADADGDLFGTTNRRR